MAKKPKYIAEQFFFPFANSFFVGDVVVVTPTHEDDFSQFVAKVTKVITKDENNQDCSPLLVVDNVDVGNNKEEEWILEVVYPHQCRLATAEERNNDK